MKDHQVVKKPRKVIQEPSSGKINRQIHHQRNHSCSPALTKTGFTLIEIVIFILLVGFFLAAIIAPYVTSVSKNELPETVTSAVFLADARMEELIQASYSSITSDASPVALTGNYASFSRQVTVTLVDANMAVSGSDVGYKKVVVTVYHSQLPGTGVSVTSLCTDYKG
jgi:type II secretory pathway pseudopilin PulG